MYNTDDHIPNFPIPPFRPTLPSFLLAYIKLPTNKPSQTTHMPAQTLIFRPAFRLTTASESQSTSAAISSGCPFFSNFESKKPSRYPLTIRSRRSEVEMAGVLRVGRNRPSQGINVSQFNVFIPRQDQRHRTKTHPAPSQKRTHHHDPY